MQRFELKDRFAGKNLYYKTEEEEEEEEEEDEDDNVSLQALDRLASALPSTEPPQRIRCSGRCER